MENPSKLEVIGRMKKPNDRVEPKKKLNDKKQQL